MVNYRYIAQFSDTSTIILLSSSTSVNRRKCTTITVKLETFEHHGQKNLGLYVTKGRP